MRTAVTAVTATLILTCTLISCRSTPPLETARSLSAQIANSLNSGSPDKLKLTLAQHAVLVRSNGPALVGAVPIAASYAKAFKQVGYKVSLLSEQLEQAGNYVVDRGTFAGTLSTADGKSTVPISGEYLHVLTNDLNGGWKFWRGSWTFADPRATSCSDTGARSCCCTSIDADDCVARPNEGCDSTRPISILLP